ncbi:hypothetical protein RYX36_027352, partial [Vicia faba]
KLVLYPSGSKSKNVKDYISLYLVLEESSSLHPGWEIYVNFKLFLFDHNNDNNLVVQDAGKKEWRFHRMKVEWGFDQFISLKDFNLCSKGYLVFIYRERNTGKGESLTMMKDALPFKHVWEIKDFSKLDSECCESEPFNVGNFKWQIKLYPKGRGIELGKYLALYLTLVNPTALSPGFLLISNSTSQYSGFLVKDTCYIDAEVTVLGVVDA